MNDDFFARTPHQGFLLVSGRDAAKFLQGYVTCDMEEMTGEVSRLGAICNLQGRMVTSFRMAAVEDGYLLNMTRALVPASIEFLRKYIPFFKATMTDASDTFVAVGITGAGAAPAIGHLFGPAPEAGNRVSAHAGVRIFNVSASPPAFELWVDAAKAEETTHGLRERLAEADAERWALAEIGRGLGWVTEATREEFIPQMMNLQLVGGISFDKGCYLGQEIVARMQYRGQLKRRMIRAQVKGSAAVPPGADLVDGEGKRVGKVVESAPSESGRELLAIVQLGDAPADVRLPSGEALTVLPLPYAIE